MWLMYVKRVLMYDSVLDKTLFHEIIPDESKWLIGIYIHTRIHFRLFAPQWILLVPYTCAAACDTIISASLCWYLYKIPTYFEEYAP